MSGQATPPSPQTGNAGWGLRLAMIVPSLIWVLVMLSVIFHVGPGPKLFNNNLFWIVFVVIFIGPQLISKRGRARMNQAHNDRVVSGFRLLVELPVTVWFCVVYPGYWWLGAIVVGTVLLHLYSPRLERAAAQQQALKASRQPRPPEDA